MRLSLYREQEVCQVRLCCFWSFLLERLHFIAVSDTACCFLLPIFAAGCLLRAQRVVSSEWNAFSERLAVFRILFYPVLLARGSSGQSVVPPYTRG